MATRVRFQISEKRGYNFKPRAMNAMLYKGGRKLPIHSVTTDGDTISVSFRESVAPERIEEGVADVWKELRVVPMPMTVIE